MSDFVQVSIIICTSNRAPHLRQTLAAIGELCAPADMPTEVVVVDNGSTDDTAEVAQQCRLPNMPVRWILEPQRGKGYAYNRGMAEALGQVFLFTDDDVRPPSNWIAGMCGPILSGEADAVAGGVELAPHLHRPWMTKAHRGWLASTEWLESPVPQCMIGANMAFSRRVLEKVPSFDTDLGPGALGFYDETLFSWQLKAAGYRMVSALNVAVEHHFETSRLQRQNFLNTAEKYGRSLAYVYHHWYHNPPLSLRQSVGPIVRLLLWRLIHVGHRQAAEGMPEKEMLLLERCWLIKYMRREQRNSRKYDRQGLRKLSQE